jgi:hypothetical protein
MHRGGVGTLQTRAERGKVSQQRKLVAWPEAGLVDPALAIGNPRAGRVSGRKVMKPGSELSRTIVPVL